MKKIRRTMAVICVITAFFANGLLIPVQAQAVSTTMHYAEAILDGTAFNRVEINWNGTEAENYTVECSNDGITWSEMESNSSEKNILSYFTFDDTSSKCYSYLDYNWNYVRVVSDSDVSNVTVTATENEDVAPVGSALLFEESDGVDIKSSATEKIDERLNNKKISTSSYVYWGNADTAIYDFDVVNVIVPLGEQKEISRFEVASYYNAKSSSFTNYFANNYEISYVNSDGEAHSNSEGWNSLANRSTTGGQIIEEFNTVNATHLKFTMSGGGVKGKNYSKVGSLDDTSINKIATFLSYIGVYTCGNNKTTSMNYGTFLVDSDVPSDKGDVDLVMFMGQSNMAGRGEANDCIVCPTGQGYEFRAISDPTKLYDAIEPFGVDENNTSSGVNEPNAKTGSMVSSLMKSYYENTGVPMVGVSCSKGGSSIDFWQPNGAPLNDAISRYTLAKKYLSDNGYTVRRKLMVWCQGESDADLGTPIAEYTEKTQAMAQAMIDEGVEKCFVVRIGHKKGSDKYDEYITAQSELCSMDERFVMASEKFADLESVMKDEYHYKQEGYDTTGMDAGINIAAYYGDQKQIPASGSVNVLDKYKTDTNVGITVAPDFDGIVLVGLYDSDGVPEDIKILEDNSKAATLNFSLSSKSKSVRIFNWDNLTCIKPIEKSKTIDIASISNVTSLDTDSFLYGTYENTDAYAHSMPYRYFLPINYDSTKEYPILMYLHGAGRRGDDNENQLNNPKPLFDMMLNEDNISKYQCIIVAPQCPSGEQWVNTPWGNGSYDISSVSLSDNLSMAKDIILRFESKFSVDKNRIYIAGQSMGGYGVWDMIMRNPDMFAAAIPQCAAGDPTEASRLTDMAIWAHHGEADGTVPLSGSREMVSAIKTAGSTNIRYTQYPNVGHEVQVEAFKEEGLLSWLFSKSRTTNSVVKDDYTYLRVNDQLIRSYSEPRPVKENGKVYISAKTVAEQLGYTFENDVISGSNKSMTLTAANSKIINNFLMVEMNELKEAFGISAEFDDVSNTASIKSSVQRNGALKIESVSATLTLNDTPAQYAIDGKLDTRWSSAISQSNPESAMILDLGEKKCVSSLDIAFYNGNGRQYDFDVFVSNDGETWKSVNTFSSCGTTNDYEKFEFEAVNARYVKYAGRGATIVSTGAQNIYNSFWEIEIYGSDEPLPEPTELTIASAEANSSASTDVANNAFDKNTSTRWTALTTTAIPENTITFDMGQRVCLADVDIFFYAGNARAYDFDIYASDDGIKWTKLGTYASDGKTNGYECFVFQPVNGRYIRYSGRGSTVVLTGSANIYNSIWEFRVNGFNEADPTLPNLPRADDVVKIIVTGDDELTTYDSIGLKWSYDGDEDIKYYSVERVSDGITEFKTDGEISQNNYVDKGTSERPAYGPYESDYTTALNNRYYLSDMSDNTSLLSDAGATTRVYEAYEGIPLVSGGEYEYVVKGYGASGDVLATSDLTKLKTKERENTASIIFNNTPKAGHKGFNMSVSTVTGMENAEYGGASAWHFTKNCDISTSNLGLVIDDNSGLIDSQNDRGYLVKITWGDMFFNSSATARLNLQRTSNEKYNTLAYDDWKNFIMLESGSGSQNNKWYTREIAYYGKNNHSLKVNGILSDIALNAFYAGNYGRFYIKSIEITKWDGPEERPFSINMPSMFSDNMILQRDAKINVWGRMDGLAESSGTYTPANITAEIIDEHNNVAATTTVASDGTRKGSWTATLNSQSYASDKSYTLRITASQTKNGQSVNAKKEYSNIIFGDVYLCAGQSNMKYGPEYPYWTDYHEDLALNKFDNNKIRIISNENRTISNFWETDTNGWKESNTQNIYDESFSATATYYAYHLFKENGNVPIGLISSAVGGASIETFLVNPVNDSNGATLYTGNSILYNRMIYPYTNPSGAGMGANLSGVIWYQGEADATGTKMSMSTYTKCMEQMVQDYRGAFNKNNLPFMYVQLAPFTNVDYTSMREAQLDYMMGINTNFGKPQNVGMAVITDISDNIADIHPRNKSEVGRRLSLWAQKLVYNKTDIEHTGPIFQSTEKITYNGNEALKINFNADSVVNGLTITNSVLKGMKISGADKVFKDASNFVLADDKKSIIIWSDEILLPEYVRYGYYSVPTDASIFNADGLPASPFRSDRDE